MAVTINKLEAFLSKLEHNLIEGAKNMTPSLKNIPAWALSCPNLFYTDKSIPPDLNEPGKLFITYKINQPKIVQLRGKSKDKKPIIRNLIVEQKASSITISSKHVDISNQNIEDLLSGHSSITYSGTGKNFKIALDQYFSNSKLKKTDYAYNTELNVQTEGDAFLFHQTLATKGSEVIAKEIVTLVREIFDLIPEDKQLMALKLIDKAMNQFNELLQAGNTQNIAHHYDARLWMIVDSICKSFDPLLKAEDKCRLEKRERLIAECCTKHMRGESIIPCLASYINAMKMHHEILDAFESQGMGDEVKKILEEYQKQQILPEIKEHHEKIQEYYKKCRATK